MVRENTAGSHEEREGYFHNMRQRCHIRSLRTALRSPLVANNVCSSYELSQYHIAGGMFVDLRNFKFP